MVLQYVCFCNRREGRRCMSYCSHNVLSFFGKKGKGRNIEKVEPGDRGRGWCVFSWSTSSLMLALICLGWKLSTRLEYWWLLVRIHPPHPHPTVLLSFYLSLIFTPSFILSTHTLHSVCSTDFLPPVSPPFYPPHFSSLPMQLHFADPNFPSTPSLLFFYPSFHLTSLYLSHCSVYHLPATLSSSIPPPFRPFSSRSTFLPIPPLILPSASSLQFAVFSAFSNLVSQPPVLLILVCLLSPFSFSLFLSVSFFPVWISFLVYVGHGGDETWNQKCVFVCVLTTKRKGRWTWKIARSGRERHKKIDTLEFRACTGDIHRNVLCFQIQTWLQAQCMMATVVSTPTVHVWQNCDCG